MHSYRYGLISSVALIALLTTLWINFGPMSAVYLASGLALGLLYIAIGAIIDTF